MKIEAYYEAGVFRPITPLDFLDDHAKVVLDLSDVWAGNMQTVHHRMPNTSGTWYETLMNAMPDGIEKTFTRQLHQIIGDNYAIADASDDRLVSNMLAYEMFYNRDDAKQG